MLPKLIEVGKMSKKDIREFIADVERQALAKSEEGFAVATPLTNHFSKGVYAREIFIPAGSVIIGKIHRHENLNILAKGDLTLLSIEGCTRVRAPFTVVSPPGVKRLAYAHEDSVWITIHGTNEKDLQKIEDEFIVKSYDELEERDF